MSTLIPQVIASALSDCEAIRVSYPRPGALSVVPTVSLTCVDDTCQRVLAFTHTVVDLSTISQRAALVNWEVTHSNGIVIVTCPDHSEQQTSIHKW